GFVRALLKFLDGALETRVLGRGSAEFDGWREPKGDRRNSAPRRRSADSRDTAGRRRGPARCRRRCACCDYGRHELGNRGGEWPARLTPQRGNAAPLAVFAADGSFKILGV